MWGLFFDVEPKPGHMPHYFEHVARLQPVLARHEGLAYLERFHPVGRAEEALLSHQLWRDEEAIAAWRRDPAHRVSQAAGRRQHFARYRIRVGPQIWARGPDLDMGEPPAGPGRFLMVVYGDAPLAGGGAGPGEAYESVSQPGRFVTLIAEGAGAAVAAQGARLASGARTLRVFRIARDYTLTDRREAPTG